MGQENDYESAFDSAASEDNTDTAATPTGDEDESVYTTGTGEDDTGDEEAGDTGDDGEAGDDTGDEETGDTGDGADDAARSSKGPIDEEALAAAYHALSEQRRKEQESDKQKAEEAGDEATSPRDMTWQDYLSDEEKTELETYEKDWSEVSRAEQIKRDAHLRHVQDVVYSDVASALAPLVEQFRTMQVEAHFNSIRSRHEDFDSIKDDVKNWVAEQPEFLRPTLEQVLEKGSADQVSELIDTYKQTKETTGAAPNKPASSVNGNGDQKPPKKPARKPPSESARRATSAAPSAKRSSPPKTKDPDNFDGAFEEAAGIG